MSEVRFSNKDFSRSRRNKDHNKVPSFLDGGYPTPSLLLAANPPVLAENKIVGSYSGVSEYLEIHYDLLLEDFMFPLRRALREFQVQKRRPDTLNGARVYKKVQLRSVQTVRRFEEKVITCVLDIDASSNVHAVKPTFGCLLVFTRNNLPEDMFLGTVISDSTKNEDLIVVQLKLTKKGKTCLQELSCNTYVMIEAEAFFYVYFHVLKAIRGLTVSSFPMKRYIIDGCQDTVVRPPAYLSESNNLKIFDKDGVEVLNPNSWPPLRDVDMDDSQYSALKKALTEEVAVIQGPPGTGKTYFGVRLVKVLLDNVSVWNTDKSTPLLLVCQSNQALDNFLEGLLKFSTKFVRVGDQCQSRLIKPYCLKELVCRDLVTRKCHGAAGLKFQLDSIDKTRLKLSKVTMGIVALTALKSSGVISKKHAEYFTSEEIFLKWLGFKIKVDRKCDDTNLVISTEELSKLAQQLELTGDYLLAVYVREECIKLQVLIRNFKEGSRQECNQQNIDDVLSLSPQDAQSLYLLWVDAYITHLEELLDHYEDQLNLSWDKLPGKLRFQASRSIMQSAHVVGLTSTGAASRRSTVEELQSPIVVVEEAAEVLESHVVVSMTDKCQHLILLGDHKQLKPGVTTHHLASKFHLNVSLFERLLNNQIVKGTCLTKQYRMRPEISSLLKPHIYKVLEDAPGTKNRPPIRGLSKNLYFLDHQVNEERTENDAGCWNQYEVDMLIGLAKYLVFSGYAPSDITVIAMYAEQKRKLIDARDEIPHLHFVGIASVDSYQGKENEIVLVSLVRSNKAGYIGFLKEENRICVALSRARSGLYIMGDMECLTKKSAMWRHVRQRLRERNSIGRELSLVCEHKAVHKVSKAAHWAVKFCQLCVEKTKGETSDSTTTSNETVPPLPEKQSETLTRCAHCQSFYCNNMLTDLELASAMSRLKLSEAGGGKSCKAYAKNDAKELTSDKPKETAKAGKLTAKAGKLTAKAEKLTAKAEKLTAQTEKLTAQTEKLTAKTEKLTAQTPASMTQLVPYYAKGEPTNRTPVAKWTDEENAGTLVPRDYSRPIMIKAGASPCVLV